MTQTLTEAAARVRDCVDRWATSPGAQELEEGLQKLREAADPTLLTPFDSWKMQAIDLGTVDSVEEAKAVVPVIQGATPVRVLILSCTYGTCRDQLVAVAVGPQAALPAAEAVFQAVRTVYRTFPGGVQQAAQCLLKISTGLANARAHSANAVSLAFRLMTLDAFVSMVTQSLGEGGGGGTTLPPCSHLSRGH
jgi:hypothetical protein